MAEPQVLKDIDKNAINIDKNAINIDKNAIDIANLKSKVSLIDKYNTLAIATILSE